MKITQDDLNKADILVVCIQIEWREYDKQEILHREYFLLTTDQLINCLDNNKVYPFKKGHYIYLIDFIKNLKEIKTELLNHCDWVQRDLFNK